MLSLNRTHAFMIRGQVQFLHFYIDRVADGRNDVAQLIARVKDFSNNKKAKNKGVFRN